MAGWIPSMIRIVTGIGRGIVITIDSGRAAGGLVTRIDLGGGDVVVGRVELSVAGCKKLLIVTLGTCLKLLSR